MNRIPRLSLAAAFAGAAMLFANPLVAQLADTPARDQTAATRGDAIPGPTLSEVESALASIEADSGIEDSAKELLRTKYAQAIEALKEAASNAAKAAEYRESMTQAPDTAAELRAQLQELPSVETAGDVTAPGDPNDLQRELAAQRAALASLNEQLSNVTAALSIIERRPAEINVRIPVAEREMSDVRNLLASPDLAGDISSPGRLADRYILQARELKLLVELEMLTQEQLSQSVRRNLQMVQRELLTRQIENASATVNAYMVLMKQNVAEVAREISARVEKLKLPSRDKEQADLATEVKDLASQLQGVLQDSQKISAANAEVTLRLQRLTNRYDSIKKQVELDQPGAEMAQVLFEWRSLLSEQARELAEKRRWPTLSRTRLDSVQVDLKIANQDDLLEKFNDRLSDPLEELFAARGEVLNYLQQQYLDLIPRLATLESETEQYFEKSRIVRADITQHLFWIRNSPPLSVRTLGEIPSGLRWAFSREHLSECGLALGRATDRSPMMAAAAVLFAITLLVLRPRIGTELRRTGRDVGRVSNDRFSLTTKAVLWTALLAVPIPLIVGYLAWALGQADAPSAWLREINAGMTSLILIIATSSAISACCHPGGLGDRHFGWREKTSSWLRGLSRWFAVVYVPLALLTYCTLSSESGRFLHSLGRASLLIALIWFLVIVVRLFLLTALFQGTHGQADPTRPAVRSRHLWSIPVIGVPLGLMVLLGLGYTMATLKLSFSLVLTLIAIVSGVILYELALRWFKVRHRRLAFAEAVERRRVRQVAAASEDQREETEEVIGEEVISVDVDELELDLDSVGDQTRSVLKLFFGLGIAIAILSLWSTTIPLISYLDTIKIPLTVNFTLLGLMKAALIVGVTWLVTKNLPGMLELALLRATLLETGTRHAIATICQYSVVAIGIALLFNALNLDWAKFGWVAGGLSVGIGFGLQEVVANFVCGLILLFERPIRVGDVVTIEGTTGTVTRIHLRATTITNWDRQEFVVPNKTLITSTLLNWTLSAPLNRILIPVGVAYGSDTERARQVMLDVAADHPRILEDPPPAATFEQFGDSSLNLLLRAFIPNLENRIATVTELHTEIHKRFKAAGIEIAFPQRDVHIRTNTDDVNFAGKKALPESHVESIPQSERSASK